MTLHKNKGYYAFIRKHGETEFQLIKRTDFSNSLHLGDHLRNEGYAVSIIFTQADVKRARNKAYLKGPASLNAREIKILDTFEKDDD